MLWHLFDVMTKLLTSWRYDFMTNFLNHDICLTSWQTFYIMTYLWLHDKLLTLWQSFWRITNFVTSLRFLLIINMPNFSNFSFWNNDETFNTMTNFLTSWCVYDIMTMWQTVWRHAVCCTYWRHDELFDELTHFLTSWLTFVFLTYLFYYFGNKI